MYGKTMSIPDELMMMYFELITDIPWLSFGYGKQDSPRRAAPDGGKRRLAREIVARFHSVDAALEAEAEFNRVFRTIRFQRIFQRLSSLRKT